MESGVCFLFISFSFGSLFSFLHGPAGFFLNHGIHSTEVRYSRAVLLRVRLAMEPVWRRRDGYTTYDIVLFVAGWMGWVSRFWSGMAWGVCVHGIFALQITEPFL